MHIFNWVSCLLFAVSVATKEAPTELQIETTYLPDDCTEKAKQGDQIQVHYTGRLFENGRQFDSSRSRGAPFRLILGAGQVIRGWDEGLMGMCLHENRTITIPSELGYGARGAAGIIPPHAALVFDVELVGLEATTPPVPSSETHEEL